MGFRDFLKANTSGDGLGSETRLTFPTTKHGTDTFWGAFIGYWNRFWEENTEIMETKDPKYKGTFEYGPILTFPYGDKPAKPEEKTKLATYPTGAPA